MAGTPIFTSGLVETATLIREGPAHVTGAHFVNEDSAARFIQLFDVAAAANVVVGTTLPLVVLAAAQNDSDDLKTPMSFVNGIVATATTTATGNGAPTAAKCHLTLIVE